MFKGNQSLIAILILDSLAYGFGIMMLIGAIKEDGSWYSMSDHYRAQTEALLRGELALSNSPWNVAHDLTWSNNGVHQVWGLGIPLWRVPFTFVAQLFGYSTFPEHFATAIALALMGLFTLKTFLVPALRTKEEKGSLSPAFASCFVILGFPPFISLLRTRFDVYEEALVHTYIFGVVLGCLIIEFTRRPAMKRWYFLMFFAGFGALIRPSLLFYALCAFGIASLVLFRCVKEKAVKNFLWKEFLPHWIAGGFAFSIGIVVLMATNFLRFGAPLEFGHKLNLQNLYGSMYATRFDHPFETEPFLVVFKEMAGALCFPLRMSGNSWYETGLYVWQANAVRWREFYFPTFDWSYFFILGVGISFALRRRRGLIWQRRSVPFPEDLPRHLEAAEVNRLCKPPWRVAQGSLRRKFIDSMRECFRATLTTNWAIFLWAAVSFCILFVFYLRTPPLSSRYLMDFGPALAFMLLISIRAFFTIPNLVFRRVLLFALAGWLIFQYAIYQSPYSPASGDLLEWVERKRNVRIQKELLPFPKFGKETSFPGRTRLPYDGSGDDPGWFTNKAIAPHVILWVENPDFLELHVRVNTNYAGKLLPANPEWFRAKVGLELLKRETVKTNRDGYVIRFQGPHDGKYKQGVNNAYIVNVPNSYLAKTNTPWLLEKAKWRE